MLDLAKIRQRHNISQGDLARAAGVPNIVVSNLERGLKLLPNIKAVIAQLEERRRHGAEQERLDALWEQYGGNPLAAALQGKIRDGALALYELGKFDEGDQLLQCLSTKEATAILDEVFQDD